MSLAAEKRLWDMWKFAGPAVVVVPMRAATIAVIFGSAIALVCS
jgi:hypothetical protein